jgi:hypothetical protein
VGQCPADKNVTEGGSCALKCSPGAVLHGKPDASCDKGFVQWSAACDGSMNCTSALLAGCATQRTTPAECYICIGAGALCLCLDHPVRYAWYMNICQHCTRFVGLRKPIAGQHKPALDSAGCNQSQFQVQRRPFNTGCLPLNPSSNPGVKRRILQGWVGYTVSGVL